MSISICQLHCTFTYLKNAIYLNGRIKKSIGLFCSSYLTQHYNDDYGNILAKSTITVLSLIFKIINVMQG